MSCRWISDLVERGEEDPFSGGKVSPAQLINSKDTVYENGKLVFTLDSNRLKYCI